MNCEHTSLLRSAFLSKLIPVIVFFCLTSNGIAQDSSQSTDRIEVQFELPNLQGNPFDFTANDVQVKFSSPNQTVVSVPAFFDGGATWRARFRPATGGHYSFQSVTLNAVPTKIAISKTEFDLPDLKENQFIRVDPKNSMRFAFEDGSPFYPVGYNLAWRSHGDVEMPPLVDSLNRMGKVGVNWTRIWMNYWDGKNLDWPLTDQPPLPLGTLLLPVARVWDAIVDAADKNHIHFQMVLQHHGQYSNHTDPNWQLNPWNKTNGGWLNQPEDFFTDSKAIQLTKNKFRYIVARWGYSPAIMAFELFNEVESTNGYKKDLRSVAAWHKTMAAFLREQDRYKHLITTSSNTTEPALWPATDYYQAHAYPSDLISAIAGLDDQKLTRPYFYGEMGASSSSNNPAAETLHQILWASLMSNSAGSGQFWDWFDVEPQNLLSQFTSVQQFIKLSGLLSDQKLKPARIESQTANIGPLSFGPGLDWAPSTSTNFAIDSGGTVENLGGMSAFLQGRGETHAMFPFATFDVNYPQAGTFAIEVNQITAAGAKLEASVDGKRVAALSLGSRNRNLDATLEIPVPAGPHQIRLENTGADWARIHQFVLTPYTSQLAVLGKTDDHLAVLWVYRRDAKPNGGAITGKINITGLKDGSYHVVWWDTKAGKVIKEEDATVAVQKKLEITTPLIEQDAAAWIIPKN